MDKKVHPAFTKHCILCKVPRQRLSTLIKIIKVFLNPSNSKKCIGIKDLFYKHISLKEKPTLTLYWAVVFFGYQVEYFLTNLMHNKWVKKNPTLTFILGS